MAGAANTVFEHLRWIHVKPENMEWHTTQFEGCEMKPLYGAGRTGYSAERTCKIWNTMEAIQIDPNVLERHRNLPQAAI